MNPTIKKLPKSVQSLICASNQINNYTKAAQELVFNALDADATSIAVRINISEGFLQVIDNGCGISQADFMYLGQNYMTSKLVDISTLKSAPNKYGFQGRSLANLAQISETLNVTSRFWKCDSTYEKTFVSGKTQSIAKCHSRPSKGTTVEIKGFLYNLSIQKKSTNLLSELQGIKIFMEHISLVHSSISLSLRNDSENDIVFKIHKNRDIYQTLSNLYDIEKTNVQELQVEKNQYKVKGYVGKRDVESTKRFIFLNGKCIINDSSLLHKKVNENFMKLLRSCKQIIKKNSNNDEENYITGNKIPFYFIFITCPYMDYELTNMILEFKDWEQINMILDKLVKFYIGDIKLKVVPKKHNAKFVRNHENESNNNQIEKIMQRILGNHCKKPGISQMQNGIKGKLIKRKNKSKTKLSKTDPTRLLKANNQQELLKQGSSDSLANEHSSNKTDMKLGPKPKNVRKGMKNGSETVYYTKTSAKKINKSKTIMKHNSKITTQKKQLKRNDYVMHTKHFDKQRCKKISLNNKFAMETESVKRRCELLVQETKKLIENNESNTKVFRNENVQTTNSKIVNSNKNIHTNVHQKVSEIVIHEYIPKSKFNINNKIEKNYNNELFKTNYDLLQTIINSQRENNIVKENIVSQKKHDPDLNDELSPLKTTASDYNHVPLVRELNYSYHSDTSDHNIFRESDKNKGSCQKMMPDDLGPLSIDMTSSEVVKPSNSKKLKELYNFNTPIQNYIDNSNFKSFDEKTDANSLLQSVTLDGTLRPYLARASDDTSPFQVVTFQSYNYIKQDFRTDTNIKLYNLCKRPKKFITTQSRENFMILPKIQYKKNFYSKLFQANNHKRKQNKSMKVFNIKNNTIDEIRESYTIEFTESNKYHYTPMLNNYSRNVNFFSTVNNKANESLSPSMSYIFNDPCYQYESPASSKSCIASKNGSNNDNDSNNKQINDNTYPITSSYNYNNNNISFNHENNNETYTIQGNNNFYNENEKSEIICNTDKTASDYNVFVSKSEEYNDERQIRNPIDVCETVFEDKGLSMDMIREFNMSFESKRDSCQHVNNNIANEIESLLNGSIHTKNSTPSISFHAQNEVNALIKPQNLDELKEVSHHFTLSNKNLSMQQHTIQILNNSSIAKSQPCDKNIASIKQDKQNKGAAILDASKYKNDTGAFNIKNRMFFIPKGMSPIFEDCQPKLHCEYDPLEHYYTDKIYNDFVDKVQNDTEIFKPRIEGTSDTTIAISKVSNKRNKEHASLKFDVICIKNANVLGQVDCKFIAATMKSKNNKSHGLEEFLVLFDQHAIHERIRLETNLAYYLMGSQWKSVTIDEVTLKMSKDEILYLHNYKDKFTQFGLEWNILNYNEVSITAIPEGILGKNPRQVDKIIKALKNLITEEISIIQTQRGCISLYPKAIMDLVFSEACRYAIKFGDHLSKSQCVELVNGLSDCKTPFQCAHGRPAMAVIMKIENNQHRYKINFNKLKRFKK